MMRIVGLLVLVWLVVGAVAAGQRGYFTRSEGRNRLSHDAYASEVPLVERCWPAVCRLAGKDRR